MKAKHIQALVGDCVGAAPIAPSPVLASRFSLDAISLTPPITLIILSEKSR